MLQHTCAAMAAALILVACQPDSQVPVPSPDSRRVATATNDSLRLVLELPARARAGEEITIALHTTNVTDRTLELYLQGREPTADVVVRTSSNHVVWHLLAGAAVPGILRLEPLAPGATLTVRASWGLIGDDGAPVAPGVYEVSAQLLAERPDALQFPPAWIEILP